MDCLKYIRALRELGIGVCFEKENINTLEMDTELMLTFMGAFAQAESESISENVKWGKRHAIREGNVFVNFKRLYGYYLNEDGTPEIDPDKAETIRSIFQWYLEGDSLRMIKQKLEGAGIPNPSGEAEWKTSAIKTILANEKYCGDALGQKTFKDNLMSGRIVKNTGQLPMVLVQNNHPAIVSRETYQAVQAELARRNAGRSPSQKSAPTGRSCYASKYALSERLVCGECGTLYHLSPDDDYPAFGYYEGLPYLRDFYLEVHYEGTREQDESIRRVINERGKTVYATAMQSGAILVDDGNIRLLGNVKRFDP